MHLVNCMEYQMHVGPFNKITYFEIINKLIHTYSMLLMHVELFK